jgi:hypothetical protein
MKNNMKVIMESWRRLKESEEEWNQSNDSDSSIKATLVVFNEEDISKAKSYPDDSGRNHGMTSHANKHANEFGLDISEPFMKYVLSVLKSGNTIFVRSSKANKFLSIDADLMSKIKTKDSEARKSISEEGSNMDILYNSFFGDEKQKLVVAKTSIDFYHDVGNKQMTDVLMGKVNQKYNDIAIKHHKDCEKTYSDQATSKTWCVDDDSLSISYGGKLSTLYKPKSISKALSRDRTLTNLINKLKQTGNEKEIEKIKNKLNL